MKITDKNTKRLSVSRRTFVGGAVAAATLGIAATEFRPRPAEAVAGAQFLGSNDDVFLDILYGMTVDGTYYPGVPGLQGMRIYGSPPNGDEIVLPPQWPLGSAPGFGGPTVYSIYPPLALDNATIQQLAEFVLSAPLNSYLIAWPEALSGSSDYSYITPANMYDCHVTLNELCAGTTVTYGSCFGGGDLPTLFESVPPNLGFYAIDLYDDPTMDAAIDRLDTFISLAKPFDTITPNYPQILISETNSGVESDRPAWFTAVANRMHTYGANSIGVLTHWACTPGQNACDAPLSGPWDPTDTATVDAMDNIINNIFNGD